MSMDRVLNDFCDSTENIATDDLEHALRKAERLFDSYRSQADVYEEEIEEIKAELQRREEEIDNLESDIAINNRQIENLEYDLTDEELSAEQRLETQTQIENLRSEIEKWEEKIEKLRE